MSGRIGRTGRRKFIVLGGGAVLAVAVGGAALASASEGTPSTDWSRCECSAGGKNVAEGATKENRVNKILVAYASRCGSTGEIAAAIGEELCAAGAETVVLPVKEVKSLAGFDAVVLGSATRMGKLLPEATEFLKKNAADPALARIAYFTAGTGPLDPDPVKREEGMTKPVAEWKAIREPVATSVFAGKVDHTKMSFPWKQMLSFVKEGAMADADHRDFDAIRAWAREAAPSLRTA